MRPVLTEFVRVASYHVTQRVCYRGLLLHITTTMNEARQPDVSAPAGTITSDIELPSGSLLGPDNTEIRPSNDSTTVSQTQHGALSPAEVETDGASKLENEASSNVKDTTRLHASVPHSETTESTSENVQNCIVHAPDLLQAINPRTKGGAKLAACLNKATGMSDRLGIHYQVIPPGNRTSCTSFLPYFEYVQLILFYRPSCPLRGR